jgi:dTDP-4-amino-4,6-dideoxygalactose transaminase
VNKYGWVDVGSSFLPSEMTAAFLWAQLEALDDIQTKRKKLWNKYYELLIPLDSQNCFQLPDIPEFATNNAHMFYLVCRSLEERSALIKYLKENSIQAVFHYLSLHSSPYYHDKHDGRPLPNCDRYADCLVRLPMYFDLNEESIVAICSYIGDFYKKRLRY